MSNFLKSKGFHIKNCFVQNEKSAIFAPALIKKAVD